MSAGIHVTKRRQQEAAGDSSMNPESNSNIVKVHTDFAGKSVQDGWAAGVEFLG